MHPLSPRPPLDHDGDGDVNFFELKQLHESTTFGVAESPRFHDISMLLGKALISLFTVLLGSLPVAVAVLTVLVTASIAASAFWSRPYYDEQANRILNGTSWGVGWVHIVALIGTCDSDLLNTASVVCFAVILVGVSVVGFLCNQSFYWDRSWWKEDHGGKVHPGVCT